MIAIATTTGSNRADAYVVALASTRAIAAPAIHHVLVSPLPRVDQEPHGERDQAQRHGVVGGKGPTSLSVEPGAAQSPAAKKAARLP